MIRSITHHATMVSFVALAAALPAGCGAASDEAAPAAAMPAAAAADAPAPGTPEARIALAESAAPDAIGSAATIAELGADGSMTPLREGTNGWMCIADDPATPGDDPACVDGEWQKFFEAYMTKAAPSVGSVGVAYMLRGSNVASNTDPYATAPAAGQDWVKDGPHLMLIAPDPAMFDAFPSDPVNGPYVMWKGTPYAHLMVPAGQMDSAMR